MSKRRICIITGSRADYGLLSGVMRLISQDDALQLQIIVTGAHLESRLGLTINEIQADGFSPDASIPIDLSDDTSVSVAEAVGQATKELASALAKLSPHIVVLLGDRYETLAAATASVILGIPVAHIHGGETTEGAMDELFRHAITKLSHLHFAAAELYAKRIIQMGEAAERVYVVGAPGVDAVLTATQSISQMDTHISNLGLFDPTFLVTYHPVTIRDGDTDDVKAISSLLAALDRFQEARILITGVNADPGREQIVRHLAEYADKYPKRVSLHNSLGQKRYLAVMRQSAVVIGNSSSGIVEAPAIGVPTVNIGDRQKGRLKAASIIDCDENTDAISKAISLALDPSFCKSICDQSLPYGGRDAARKIVAILRGCDVTKLRRKTFVDQPTVVA